MKLCAFNIVFKEARKSLFVQQTDYPKYPILKLAFLYFFMKHLFYKNSSRVLPRSGAIIAVLLFFCTLGQAAIQSPGAAGLPVNENDWPWWRGTQRNGHADSKSAPLTWGPDQNIAWKTEIPGRGHGTPTVVGNNIFLATALEEEKSQWVLCFDRKSGKNLWAKEVHRGGWEGRIHDRNTQASPTVACDGERLFAAFMYQEAIWVTALSLDGNQLWQKRVGDYVSHWGYSSSPAIYNSLVIVAADHKGGGKLAALDRETGASVWETPRPALPNYSSPMIYHLDGKDQLFLAGCDMMASYDPATGKAIWNTPGVTTEVVGSAVADDKRVYASGGYPKSITTGRLQRNGLDGSDQDLCAIPSRCRGLPLCHERQRNRSLLERRNWQKNVA